MGSILFSRGEPSTRGTTHEVFRIASLSLSHSCEVGPDARAHPRVQCFHPPKSEGLGRRRESGPFLLRLSALGQR